MATALEVVSLERARLELRIPPGDSDHDPLITEQIAAAVAFVEADAGVSFADMEAPVAPEWSVPVVIVLRALYNGQDRFPAAYESLIAPLRRFD